MQTPLLIFYAGLCERLSAQAKNNNDNIAMTSSLPQNPLQPQRSKLTLSFIFCVPAAQLEFRPDPGDRGGDDGDGGGHHLSVEPLPPISTLAPLQTRPYTPETPAAGQRESNTTFTPQTGLV